MPRITYKTFLMRKHDDQQYKKVVDIKDYPDLGGVREGKDVTTLSDPSFKFTPGLQANDPKEFTANYRKGDFAGLKALEGKKYDYAVWMGGTESLGVVTPTGEEGIFNFSGYLSVVASGGGVDDPREMKITIIPSSAIVPVLD